MKVRCPTCNKKATVPDGDAGLLTVCLACGSSYRVPAAPEPVPSPPVQAARVRSFRLVPPGAVVGWIGGAAAAVMVLAVSLLMVHRWRSDTAARATAHVIQLRSQAEQYIWAGKTDQAQAVYSQLQNFIADSTRPDFKQMADQVRRDLIEQRAAFDRTVSPTTAPQPAAQATPAMQAPAPSIKPAHAISRPERSPLPVVVPRPHPAAPRHSSTRPRIVPVIERSGVLTDAKIGASITRGVDQLLRHFDPNTHLLRDVRERESISIGVDILCVYALMQCQQATNDPRLNPHDPLMKGLIDAMKGLNLNNYYYETYARGLRATALALYNRPEDREALRQDAGFLIKGARAGAYTYQLTPPRAARFRGMGADRWDNSNSQYGLLGVWAAAETGFETPDTYWNLVQQHWVKTQCSNGQWDYRAGRASGTHSMTCAGLASLFVTHDYLDVARMAGDVGRDPFTPPLAKGLAWLERGNNAVQLNHGGYDLYGLERVGLASGFKYFGDHDWYRELAARTIAMQKNGGSWGSPVETAYSLLFLSRGRHPILMNKVRFNGAWANRPRDVANLARFVGYQLERPLNWQVVPLARPWTDWMDSPILYLSSHLPIPLTDADDDKIRSYVENGGLLFMQADGDARAFDVFAHAAAHKLFPKYEMSAVPPNHPLYNVLYKLKPDANLEMVTNGSRILMLYSKQDISKVWQLRDNVNRPYPFDLGTNLFIYAAGKRELLNRLASTYIPPILATPSATYRLARLSYAGDWNPEPAAWPRFARWFQLQTGYGLDEVTVPIADLKPDTAPIAALTGSARYDLTAAQAQAIKNYVQAGGVLLVDACGGSGAFDQGLQSSLYFKVFADTPSHVMAPSHPMLSAGDEGMTDLSRPRLRQFAIDRLGEHAGLPQEIVAGKGRVIFTSLDITCGLLGTHTWGILGYEPAYAEALVKNVILWTIDGRREEAPAPAGLGAAARPSPGAMVNRKPT